MKSGLFSSGSHLNEGIFRTAPNDTECKALEQEINDGHFGNIDFNQIDGELTANLIKRWFRSLPNPVLQSLSNGNRIETVQNTKDAVDIIVGDLVEPERSYFLWLIDLCENVVAQKSKNKMSATAMAVVMAPNLYDPESFENPMKCMRFQRAVVRFVQLAIEWRHSVKY